MTNRTEQIIPLTAEGPWARRLIIFWEEARGSWINFEVQQLRNNKWVTEQPTYAFQPKYVKNIPDAIIKVLNEQAKEAT